MESEKFVGQRLDQLNSNFMKIVNSLQTQYNDLKRQVQRLELEFQGPSSEKIDPWGLRSNLKQEILKLIFEDPLLTEIINPKSAQRYQEEWVIMDDMLKLKETYKEFQNKLIQQDKHNQYIEQQLNNYKTYESQLDIIDMNVKQLKFFTTEQQKHLDRDTAQISALSQTLSKKIGEDEIFNWKQSFSKEYVTIEQWVQFQNDQHNQMIVNLMSKANMSDVLTIQNMIKDLHESMSRKLDEFVKSSMRDVVTRQLEKEFVKFNYVPELERKIHELINDQISEKVEANSYLQMLKRFDNQEIAYRIVNGQRQSITIVDVQDQIDQHTRRISDLLETVRKLEMENLGHTFHKNLEKQILILRKQHNEQEQADTKFRFFLNEISQQHASQISDIKAQFKTFVDALQEKNFLEDKIIELGARLDQIEQTLTKRTSQGTQNTIDDSPKRQESPKKILKDKIERERGGNQILIREIDKIKQILEARGYQQNERERIEKLDRMDSSNVKSTLFEIMSFNAGLKRKLPNLIRNVQTLLLHHHQMAPVGKTEEMNSILRLCDNIETSLSQKDESLEVLQQSSRRNSSIQKSDSQKKRLMSMSVDVRKHSNTSNYYDKLEQSAQNDIFVGMFKKSHSPVVKRQVIGRKRLDSILQI